MSVAQKKVHIPAEGDYLTDGVRLVEVVGKCREGYEVVDARVAVESGDDVEVTEVLQPDVATRVWRQVKPSRKVA